MERPAVLSTSALTEVRSITDPSAAAKLRRAPGPLGDAIEFGRADDRGLAMKVQRTADRVSIGELLAAYVDTVNRKDYDGLRELFTADAFVDLGPAGECRGVDAIVTTIGTQVDAMQGLIQVVHTGTVRFAADDESSATGRWYISEFGVMGGGTEAYFSGVYHDEYVRDPSGEWRFGVRRYRGLFARRGADTVVRPFPTDLPPPWS
ncbi:MAG: hypothetical protein JWL73_544 [Actinomycetia bacterium]|nr:hypothetical protein [Actinomycetes bacterium]